MMFSIILPVYNSRKYLTRCLNSILSQTYGDYEVIVINDGSTDGSLEILERYATKDSRIKLFSYENGGITRARQRGFEHSAGDFIISVDSDDTINPDLLLKVSESIQEHPEVDLIRYKVKLINDLDGYDHEIYNISSISDCIFDGVSALKLWTSNSKKNDVFWMYAIKRVNMQIIMTSPNLKTNGDFAIVPLIIANSKNVFVVDYVGYNFTCDNFASLTHAFDRDSMRKRSMDFLMAYLFVKSQLRKLQNGLDCDFEYLQQNFDNRLSRRFNSLDVNLQEELKSYFDFAKSF